MKSLITVLFFVLTHVAHGQALTVTIFNKTGYDIDSLSLCKGQFFKIKADEKIKIETCESILMQDGSLLNWPGGVIYGRTKNNKPLKLCGTGIETVAHGQFLVDITIEEDEFGYRLFWTHHK